MNDFVKMDLFFVVTTAVVFLVGVCALVVLFYVVRILRSVDHVMKNVRSESDSIRADMAMLREQMRTEGIRLKQFRDFFERIYVRSAGGRKKRTANGKE